MDLLPIKEHLSENKVFTDHPDCQDSIYMNLDFFKRVGYNPPWIGYYASINNELVGAAAFKGKPIDGKVEIAYGTFPAFRHRGIGKDICRLLVQLARKTDPSVRIIAKTLPEENYSTRILIKNGFEWMKRAIDTEDGEVWEWEYNKRLEVRG